MFEKVPGPNAYGVDPSSLAIGLMECSVCYCETANCNLTCGHSFCFGCVKEWYHKCSEPTCPMCRQTLNFKGLHRLEEKWSEEAHRQQIDEIFGEFVEDVLENCEWLDFALFEIEEAQKKLQQMSDWDFDKDLFEQVLYDAIDIVVLKPPQEYDEPKTFEHTLFASKAPLRKQKGMSSKRCRESSFEPAVFELILVV